MVCRTLAYTLYRKRINFRGHNIYALPCAFLMHYLIMYHHGILESTYDAHLCYCFCWLSYHFILGNHGGVRILVTIGLVYWDTQWICQGSINQELPFRISGDIWEQPFSGSIYKRKCSCVAKPGQKSQHSTCT